MDTVRTYRQLVHQVLSEYAERSSAAEIVTQTVFDRDSDRYQLMRNGWRREFERVYGIIVHIDIIDGKIWIQEDNTEMAFADKFVELGVPKSDIVLGFRAPYIRQFTEFAVG